MVERWGKVSLPLVEGILRKDTGMKQGGQIEPKIGSVKCGPGKPEKC